MMQLLLAASLITALVALAGRWFQHTGEGIAFGTGTWVEAYRSATELPCPWCGTDTDESDRACPSCHRPFGAAVAS
ncbi:MAG: hypothetical protein GXP34_06995 [Actinobacteria bacterium]|nr:hypothetical protein [Actinomycetota bacterium]